MGMTDTTETPYPPELLDEDEDDGTMPESRDKLAEAVVGHRIVSAERRTWRTKSYPGSTYEYTTEGIVLTLDTGQAVRLNEGSDCCAYTEVEKFFLNPALVDHVITGVGTTEGFTQWHIYADLGDVLQLEVGWSCGNPFYYGYGFSITVEDANGAS